MANLIVKRGKQNPHEAALISEFTKLLDELIQNHYLMDIMNKGTHEEENGEEFERSSVEELLNKYLEPLDTMLTDKITVKQHSFVLKEKPAS